MNEERTVYNDRNRAFVISTVCLDLRPARVVPVICLRYVPDEQTTHLFHHVATSFRNKTVVSRGRSTRSTFLISFFVPSLPPLPSIPFDPLISWTSLFPTPGPLWLN